MIMNNGFFEASDIWLVIFLLRKSEKLWRILLCHKSTFICTRKMYKYVADVIDW